ncbi:MAG: DUF3052 domain-containing protein [Gammaproteobacteria bacterium]
MAGYSKTPLFRKLGLPGSGRAVLVDAPAGFVKALGPLPKDLKLGTRLTTGLAYIHAFVRSNARLHDVLPRAARALAKDGTLWIYWPKQASGLATDFREGEVRACGLAAGLVDVKICAVDEIWSGLKFVYRLRDR